MPIHFIQRHLGFLLFWSTVLLLTSPTAAAAEADQAAQFVAALRERGWHDTALEYLATAADDPIATPEFLQRVGYERALTLASLAKQGGSEKKRLELQESAIAELLRYAQENRGAPLSTAALRQAGNLLAKQALYGVAKAKKLPSIASSQRKQLMQAARVQFDKAAITARQVLDDCEKQLKALPKAAAADRSSKGGTSRQKLEAQQAESRFFSAKLSFEKAQTYSASSEEFRQTIKTAAEDFSKLFSDYSEKLVGFYGRLYEGRCYQQVENYAKALQCYEDLIDQPIAHPDFRRLIARAYRRRAECHLAQGNPELVVRECRRALEAARGEQRRQAEWLAVAFRLAEAYAEQASPLSAGSNEAKRLRSDARQLLRDVARQPGEFQQAARVTLISLGSSGGSTERVVNSFADALAAGRAALDTMNSSKLAARLAKNNNPEAEEGLKQQAQQHKVTAVQHFQHALQLTDTSTSSSDLNSIRYYLCWLYWEDGRIEEAAVLGEFLARRYPESSYAPVGAKVALAAYEMLYNNAKKTDAPGGGKFEAQRLAELAELIASQWADSPEAATAVGLLINIAIREDRIDEAQSLLGRLPKASRNAAEASLGSALWTRYLRVASSGEATEDDLIKLRKRAATLLSGAFDSIAANANPSRADATAVLYFVQLLLAEGDAARAVEVLEHTAVGPLTLLQQGDEVVDTPQFSVEAYKAALRAYVSVAPPKRRKARKMMTELDRSVGNDKDAQDRLTQIYVSLGRQLQQQVKELTAGGQAAKAREVADAFGDLLQQIASQGDTTDWATQNWLALTNLQLGEGLSGQDAASYLQRAEESFRLILKTAEQDARFAPSKLAILGTRKRLGDCQQALGNYQAAFDQYTAILAEKPSMFELQYAAAMTLQQWGANEKDVKKIEQAIRGTQPNKEGKNLVWGWLRLAAVADYMKKKADQSPGDEATRKRLVAKYLDLFFDSRYNAAKARFLAAQSTSGASRSKHLQVAKQSVVSMRQLYPELGSPKWKQAFGELLKEIENAQQ